MVSADVTVEAFSSHDPSILVVFHSQMNSALEQLEKSVSEMIALYAGREGIYMYCKINVTIYVYIVDSYKQMLHNPDEHASKHWQLWAAKFM